MSATQVLSVVILVWLAIGLTASIVMGRRGHSAFTWLLVGSILGPLSIPVAIGAVRSERTAAPMERTAPTSAGGSVDVLVGIDGSPESLGALRRSVSLFGGRIGRLVLATVVDVGAAARELRDAEDDLDRLALESMQGQAGSVVLSGRPADALVDYAVEHGFEILVVGPRGRGASKALLGSTASSLGRRPELPVLIA